VESDAVKLFFCDICNESIPLQDIKDNRATTIKGKIFCRACNPLNELIGSDAPPATGGAAPAARVEVASSGGAIAMLFVGLVASLGASGYLLYERAFGGAEQTEQTASRLDRIDNDLQESKRNANMIAGNVEGLAPLRSLPARIDALQEEVARIRGEITSLGSGLTNAEKNLNTVGSLRERLDQAVLRQDESARSLGRLEGMLEQISAQVREVSDRPPLIVTSDTATNTNTPAPSETTGDAALDERLNGLIEQLSSPDAMVRWEAVDKIRAGKEKALVPYVVKALSDRDMFVRAQAIYTLGELRASSAVPDLIKMLRDEEATIRDEALTALVEITGQTIRFDTSNKTEREKGIKRWEDWYAKNK
jgi:HEAT repeats